MKMSKSEAGIIVTIIIAISSISFAYAGNNGVPFDELWEAIFGIQEEVEDIQSTLDLHAEIAELHATVNYLESRLTVLELVPGPQGPAGSTGPEGPEGPQGLIGPAGGFGAPDFDSGWVELSKGENLIGTLSEIDASNVFVYLMGRLDPLLEAHQYYYGVDMYDPDDWIDRGATWYFDYTQNLYVVRGYFDEHWTEARVIVWELPS